MWLWWIGCAGFDVAPLVEGRGGGAGYWPPHSSTALAGAVQAELDGIELDVRLTADGVPVLWGDEALASPDCIWLPDTEQPVAMRIPDTLWAAIDGRVACGGAPDPAYPNALVVHEPLMSLDDALDLWRELDAHGMRVHLHARASPVDGASSLLATEVLHRWQLADLPLTLHVSADTMEGVRAFEAESRRRAMVLDTALRLHHEDLAPRPAELRQMLRSRWEEADPLELASMADADGVALSWRALQPGLLRRAQRRGVQLQAMTVADADALRDLATAPLQAILTDWPGSVPGPDRLSLQE